MDKCHHLVKFKSEKSLNVVVSGTISMYDRNLPKPVLKIKPMYKKLPWLMTPKFFIRIVKYTVNSPLTYLCFPIQKLVVKY